MGRHVLPAALRRAEIHFRLHDDLFDHLTLDVEWIPRVAREGFVAVTFDARIGQNALELRAVHAAGLKMIACAGASAPMDQVARNFVNAHPRLVRFATRHPGPFIAKLSRPPELRELQAGKAGELRMYRSRDDLIARFGPVPRP